MTYLLCLLKDNKRLKIGSGAWMSVTSAVAILSVAARLAAGFGGAAAAACPAVAAGLHPPPHSFVDSGRCIVVNSTSSCPSCWAINVGSSPSPALARLAQDLAADIAATTGLVLPVRADSAFQITLKLDSAVVTDAVRPTVAAAFAAAGPLWEDEAYTLTSDEGAITIAASTDTGVFRGTRTLLQLLNTSGATCPRTAPAAPGTTTTTTSASMRVCSIADAPDSPIRGFYLDSSPSKGLNQTFFREFAELMSAEGMNSVVLHSAAWFDVAGSLARLRNVSDILGRRRIKLIPEIGPYTAPETFEGLWVRDEPFTFSRDDGVAVPDIEAQGPEVGPANANWTELVGTGTAQVPAGWHYYHSTVFPGQGPCRLAGDSTVTPTGGRTVRCDVNVDPKGGHAGGFGSDPFPIDPQGFYFVRASVMVNTTKGSSMPTLLMGCKQDSAANLGIEFHPTNGHWVTVQGTFVSPIDSACVSDCVATIETRFVGSGEATWWIGDLEVMRMNSALLNVIRTNATDVNVTVRGEPASVYKLDQDYTVVPAAKPINLDNPDFIAMASSPGDALTVRRLPRGKIPKGGKVSLAYDFGTAYCGDASKPNHPVAMADAQHYTETEAAVAAVMEHFPDSPAVFFTESDEVRGMNRDSRSSRLGLSNANLLALDMNRLAAMVTVRNHDVRPMFWADMVNAEHNGGGKGYQRTFGGRAGATVGALPLLNKEIGLVPWWYTDPARDPTTDRLVQFVEGFYRNYSLHWLGGSGQSAGNNAAWAGANDSPGGGGLGIFTTQWLPWPDLSGIPAAGSYTWNHRQQTVCHEPHGTQEGS